MPSVTTYKNVGMMKVTRGPRNFRTGTCHYLGYSQTGKRIMKQIGICIKAGGYVEFDMVNETQADIKLFWK
jgi:hypothetical protein